MNEFERKVIQANDDGSMRSRVFVGNLNTMLVSREELQHRFGKYGSLRAVGIFKGYAFIQFDDEATARLAATCEDQQTIVGQKVDCNLASEPKPNQRQAGARKPKATSPSFPGKVKSPKYPSSHTPAAYPGAAGYGYPPMMPAYPGYYDPMAAYGYPAPPVPTQRVRSNSLSGTGMYDSGPRAQKSEKSPRKAAGVGVPPSKRAKADDDGTEADEADVEGHNGAQNGNAGESSTSKGQDPEVLRLRRAAEKRRLEILAGDLRSNSLESSDDVLICSTCRHSFSTLLSFVEHKRAGCSIRACAACSRDEAESRCAPLACTQNGCTEQCISAWALLRHYETAHGMALHKLVNAPAPAPAKDEKSAAAATAPPPPPPPPPPAAVSTPAGDASNMGNATQAASNATVIAPNEADMSGAAS